MQSEVFPCSICDNQEDMLCSIDEQRRDVRMMEGCPLIPISRDKPDVGKWVVIQPDGLFCYYDEISGQIEQGGMSLDEVIRYRETHCSMSHARAEQDTLAQIKYQPFKWESIPGK